MIIGIILILISLIVIAVSIVRYRTRENSVVSFKEAMNLIDLPIITVQNNNTKINLLLDTGSNSSYISPEILKYLKYEEVEITNTTVGFGGSSTHSKGCNMKINYKKLTFEDIFIVMQSDDIFTTIKQNYGVHIHGILGSKFFDRYNYIIDFSDLIAYIR